MKSDSRGYRIPTETVPTLKLEHHLSDLCAIRDLLKSRGIRTQNTRIERYLKFLTAIINDHVDERSIFKGACDPRFSCKEDWLLYVFREIHELMWILRGIKVHCPAGSQSKLTAITNGSDFAALDKNTHDRNVQFELRIASYFCQAGCEVDMSTETDLVAIKNDFSYFVECKRVASMAQLERRLVEAKAQLKERLPAKHKGRPAFGLIVMDVTKLAFSCNGLTLGLTNEHSRDVVQARLVSIGEKIERISPFTGSIPLLECWLQIHIPALLLYPETPTTRFSSYFIVNPSLSGSAAIAFHQLREIQEIGSQGDDRQLESRPLTPRRSVTFPAGTQFGCNLKLGGGLDSETIGQQYAPDTIVGRIEIHGVAHEFTVFDVQCLAPQVVESVSQIKKSPDAEVALLAELYLQRFPYDGSPEAAPAPTPDSTAT